MLRCVSIADEEHTWTASREPGFTDGMLWDPPATREEMRPFTEKCIADWRNDIRYCWTIEDRTNQTFIGRIEIRPMEENDEWEIGFWTHPREQKKGYMTEVVQEVLRFGFEDLSAKKIICGHAPWNVASKRVLEKIGFTYVGHDAGSVTKNGKPFPEERYELTKLPIN